MGGLIIPDGADIVYACCGGYIVVERRGEGARGGKFREQKTLRLKWQPEER